MKTLKRLSASEMALLVKNWNDNVAEGAAVNVERDDGTTTMTTTRSAAWVMGGHSAVIMLEGFSGAYSLQRVTAI